MKYIIFDITNRLANSMLGHAYITANPLTEFAKRNYNNFAIYKTTEDIPEGLFEGRITDQGKKLSINTGKSITIQPIENGHYVVFEPDGNFKTLGTGYAVERSFNKIQEDKPQDKAFFLFCEKSGPKVWKKAVYDNGVLDFEGDSTPAIPLVEQIKTK